MMTIIEKAIMDVFTGKQCFTECVNLAKYRIHMQDLQEKLLSMNAKLYEEIEFLEKEMILYYFLEKRNHSYCVRVLVKTDDLFVNEFSILDEEI